MTLSDRLRNAGAKAPLSRDTSLWKGPSSNEENGGISYSLLCRWLNCRERFRLYVMEGLRPSAAFHAPMDYGNMWHVCEEVWAANPVKGIDQVFIKLRAYCQEMCRKYQSQQEQVSHWYEMCKAQFPLYVDYWQHHPDQVAREPVVQEKVFCVNYKLPSGRVVYLRGKWDSIDIVKGKLWIQENKTKSQINQRQLTQQLIFDLQSMIYIVALEQYKEHCFFNRSNKKWRGLPTAGVRYNVVRRSAHKSPESMVTKIKEDQECGRISEWFSRFNVEVSKKDIQRFKHQCLNPILEELCRWWDWVTTVKDPFTYHPDNKDLQGYGPHWIHPYGVRNLLDEGGSTDLDHYLSSGSQVGLIRTEQLFPELVEGD